MALALAASAAAGNVDQGKISFYSNAQESMSAQSKATDLRKQKKSSGQSQKSANSKQKQGSELGSAAGGTAASQVSRQRMKADQDK